MTYSNTFPSPNTSPIDNYYLQANITDLNLPEYTGDFYPGLYTGDAAGKLRAELNKDYRLLIDTMNLISGDPGPDWDWRNLDSIIPPDNLTAWCGKWGNPGRWDEPITLVEFQKHALVLHLIYRLFCSRDDPSDTDMVIMMYDLLLRCPDFEKRADKYHRQHMAKFESEKAHRAPRINFLIGLIIDHEIRPLITTFNVERGFQLRTAALLPIMYYQMGVLVRSPDNEFHKVRKCQNCDMYFWGHGNRRYCYEKACDRRYVHKRKMNKGGKL